MAGSASQNETSRLISELAGRAEAALGVETDECARPYSNSHCKVVDCGGSSRDSYVVALQFAIEGGAADAEHLAGLGLVSVHLGKDALDGGALDIFKIGGRRSVRGGEFVAL